MRYKRQFEVCRLLSEHADTFVNFAHRALLHRLLINALMAKTQM